MQEWLINLSMHYAGWAYLLIIIISAVEGPIISMVLGVLIRLGYFSFWPSYICVMLGDLIADSILYYVGFHYGMAVVKKFGKYLSITEETIEKAKKFFHNHTHKLLIGSKMTNGFGLSGAILVTSGITRIPFLKFISSNFIGQFVWSGILIGVGYFFSHLYLQIDNVLGKIFLVVFFLVLITAFLGFLKYLRKRAEKI